MSNFDDSSFEMHDDSLSADDVEALFEGSSVRPDLGELETLFAEVRALPNRTVAPEVSGALAEFVGVDLTPTNEPIVLDDFDEALVSPSSTAPSAQPVRRNSMIGQAVTFLGTIGAKLAVGTTMAAAALGGAHATGAIDVPYLPDPKPAEIETVDLPKEPDALAFVEDAEVKAKAEAAAEVEVEAEAEAKADINVDTQVVDDDFPPLGNIEDHIVPDHKVEEPKAEEPKKDEPEEPKKNEDTKSPAEKAAQELIAALEEAVHVAKDKVRADATALITPLEVERDGLLADLEAAHNALAQEWEPIIVSLRADLEATSDEGERAEIEADIDAAETAWADARVAAELEVDPRLEEIDNLFEVIETERDAEIDRLLAEFFAAVEEIEKG